MQGHMDVHIHGQAACQEQGAHRRGSLGELVVDGRIPGAAISSGCSTIFVCSVAAALVWWQSAWVSHWSVLDRDGTEAMPLACVPIALVVAAVFDACLGAVSGLGRASSVQISPLTPKLCAFMVVVFAFSCTMLLPSVGHAALVSLGENVHGSWDLKGAADKGRATAGPQGHLDVVASMAQAPSMHNASSLLDTSDEGAIAKSGARPPMMRPISADSFSFLRPLRNAVGI